MTQEEGNGEKRPIIERERERDKEAELREEREKTERERERARTELVTVATGASFCALSPPRGDGVGEGTGATCLDMPGAE